MDAFEDLLTAIYRFVIFIFNLPPRMISSALASLPSMIELSIDWLPYMFESSMLVFEGAGEAPEPKIDGLFWPILSPLRLPV